MNVRLILCFLSFIALIDELRKEKKIRINWKWSIPAITDIYDYIDYDDDFRLLTRMDIDTFIYVADAMEPYLRWPREWYLKININSTIYPYKKQKGALGPRDRLMRYLMIGTKFSINGIIQIFGQKKSTIYKDFEYLSIMIVKCLGDELIKHIDRAIGNHEYDALIGDDALSKDGIISFDNVSFIMYVISVCFPYNIYISYIIYIYHIHISYTYNIYIINHINHTDKYKETNSSTTIIL